MAHTLDTNTRPRSTRRKARRRSYLGTAMALIALTSGGLAIEATTGPTMSAQAAGAEECKPVMFVFRGSGEKNVRPWVGDAGQELHYAGSNITTDGWEGSTLNRILTRFAPATWNDMRNDSYRVIPIGPSADGPYKGYPAVNAGWAAFGGLDTSAFLGAHEAAARFEEIKRGTPESCRERIKFVALGFSQGSMAARRLAAMLPDQMAGVVTIGDPLQRPFANGVVGSGVGGQGILRKMASDGLTSLYDRFYDLPTDRFLLCHHRDPICDMRLSTVTELVDHPEHSNYAQTDEEANMLSDRLSQFLFQGTARDSFGQSRVPVAAASLSAGRAAPSDTVLESLPAQFDVSIRFVLPASAAQGDWLAQAVEKVDVAAQRAIHAGARVSIVVHDADGPRMLLDETDDAVALGDALAGFSPQVGATDADDVWPALRFAARESWTEGAARSIVLLGGGDASESDEETGVSADDVRSDLIPPADAPDSEDPIGLYGVDDGDEVDSPVARLAAATGGGVLASVSDDELDASLHSVLTTSLDAPQAVISADDVAVAGRAVTISAVSSTLDDDMSFAFDLDADGVFETATSTALVTATWDAPGDRPVSVRVVDAEGRISYASTVVSVLAADALDARFDPADPVKVLALDDASGPVGGTALLRIDGLTAGEEVGVRVVRGDDDHVWDDRGLAYWDGVATDGTIVLPLAANLPAGSYRLVVASGDGGLGAGELTVTSTTLAATGTDQAPMALSASLLAGGLFALAWAGGRRFRVTRSRPSR